MGSTSASKHEIPKGEEGLIYNGSRSSIRQPNVEQAGRMISNR